MPEKSVSHRKLFDRERLKLIYVMKSDQGNYCIRVLTLNRDTLKTTRNNLYLTPETFNIIMHMGMSYVIDDFNLTDSTWQIHNTCPS